MSQTEVKVPLGRWAVTGVGLVGLLIGFGFSLALWRVGARGAAASIVQWPLWPSHSLFVGVLLCLGMEALRLRKLRRRVSRTNPAEGSAWLEQELADCRSETLERGKVANPRDFAETSQQRLKRFCQRLDRRWIFYTGLAFIDPTVGFILYCQQVASRLPGAFDAPQTVTGPLTAILTVSSLQLLVLVGLATAISLWSKGIVGDRHARFVDYLIHKYRSNELPIPSVEPGMPEKRELSPPARDAAARGRPTGPSRLEPGTPPQGEVPGEVPPAPSFPADDEEMVVAPPPAGPTLPQPPRHPAPEPRTAGPATAPEVPTTPPSGADTGNDTDPLGYLPRRAPPRPTRRRRTRPERPAP